MLHYFKTNDGAELTKSVSHETRLIIKSRSCADTTAIRPITEKAHESKKNTQVTNEN